MGNSTSKTKKKASKHNCLKHCFNKQLNKFALQIMPPIWSFTDEHLQILKDKSKFPGDVIEIILLYLPEKLYISNKSTVPSNLNIPDFITNIRCVDNSYIDIIAQQQYKSPYPFCKYYPVLPDFRPGERHLHIGMFGAGGVGKSALTDRYVKGVFLNEYDPGIEDTYMKKIKLDESVLMCEILDSYGQQEFSVMLHEWIKNCKVFIVCFSVTDKNSFHHIDSVIRQIIEIKNKAASDDGKFAIVICGNKIDLRNTDNDMYYPVQLINMDDIINKITDLGLPYVETSAKDDINVNYLYTYAVYEYWFQTTDDIIDWDNVLKKLVC